MKRLLLITFYLMLNVSFGNSQTIGSLFSFDGVDDRVTIPAHPSYAIGSGNFTIEFWMKLDAPAPVGDRVILSMRDSATSSGFWIYNDSNSVRLRYSTIFGGAGILSATPLNPLYDSQCHHYAFVRQGIQIKVYIDGALNRTYYTPDPPIISSYDIILGGSKSFSPGSFAFMGALRDIKIWSAPLSQFQILNRLRNTTNNQLTNLIGAWKLNGNFKQKVEDVSLIHNHGTRGSTAASEPADPIAVPGCPDCIMHSVQLSALTSTSVCIGDSASLKVPLLSGETCLWYRNGVLIPGAVDSIYKTPHSGIYTVKVFNSAGCSVYSNALTIKKLLEEIGNISCNSCYGVTSKYCWWSGRNDTLIMPMYGGYTYKWYKDSILIQGATSNTLPVSSAGKYYCVVQANGCSKSSIEASYLPLIAKISAVTPPKTCLDTLVTLRVDQNMYNSPMYQWKVNNTNIPGATFNQLTTSLTGSINCTVTDSLICPAPAVTSSMFVSHGVLPDLYISYKDQLDINGHDYSDCSTYNGGVLKLVDAYNFEYDDAGLISTVWSGGIGSPTAISPSQVSVSNTGDYYVNYSTACGSGSAFANVFFAGPNTVKPMVVGATSSCNPISLRTEFPFLHWDAYQWYKDGLLIPGATFSSYTATETGNYCYVLWNDCDSLMSYSHHAEILNNVTISAPNGTIICPGVSKPLVASNTAGCQWKLNGVNIPGATGGTYLATSTGNYTCQLTSSCGTFLSNVITITSGTSLSPISGTLSGPTTICSSTGNKVYSVFPVAGATSYTWVFTNGPTILSNPSSNVVTVNFPSNYPGGKVVVYANNSCSSFKIDSLLLNSLNLSAPTSILGITHASCGASSSFSCPVVQNATSYNWVIPPGVVILSGQGTTNAIISFPNSSGADTLKVNANNSCSSSAYTSKLVQRAPYPASGITGPTSVCAFQTGLGYSIPTVVGASSYLWTVPSGANIISGQGTSTIQMNMGNSTGFVTVSGVNACGSGQASNKSVQVVCKEGEELPGTQVLIASPNPFRENFTVRISGKANGAIQGFVLNMMGQIVERFDLKDGVADLLGKELSAGFYIVKVETKSGVLTSMIVKN
jgi:PKD-like domain/Concanavalin A-like lectin/glucanases superfamily